MKSHCVSTLLLPPWPAAHSGNVSPISTEIGSAFLSQLLPLFSDPKEDHNTCGRMRENVVNKVSLEVLTPSKTYQYVSKNYNKIVFLGLGSKLYSLGLRMLNYPLNQHEEGSNKLTETESARTLSAPWSSVYVLWTGV